MTMIRILVALLLLSSLSLSEDTSRDEGYWAKNATGIWGSREPLMISSPDGKKNIVVQPIEKPDSDATTIVAVKAFGHTFKTTIGEWVDAEVLWSPDSQRFAVTYSDGGALGTYHVKVVRVTRNGLQYSEPVPNGRKLFVPRCFDPEYPNVAAIDWRGHDSSRLLIAVQVPPHGSCASMGTFRAFEIAISDGRVLAKFGQIEAKKRFADKLGIELNGAEDSCIQQPTTCVPPGMKSK